MRRLDYFEASIPDTTIVLGLPLLPLSLGHLTILRRIKSVFLTGEQPIITDLAEAVLICSQTYHRALLSFEDPDRDEFMRIWHDKITGNDLWKVKLGIKKPKEIDFFGACNLFNRYLESNMRGPNYLSDSGSKTTDCPAEAIVKVALMRDLHISENELMDRSWLLCLWEYAALRSLDGSIEIVDEETIKDAQDTGAELMRLVKEGRLNGIHS